MLQVVETLIGKFARRGNAEPDLTPLRMIAGMALWMKSKGCLLDLGDMHRTFLSVVTRFVRTIRCPKCDGRISAREANVRQFFEDGNVHCFRCGETLTFDVAAE